MNRRLLLIAMGIGVLLVIAGGCGKKAQGPQETEIPEPKEPLPSRTVHVFCYHGVEDDPSNFYHSRADDFVEQMQLLQERGYESISCRQLADYLGGKEDLPEQSVLISFDDGKEVVYDNACSILEEYGYRATLFINSDTIGGEGFMTWDQVKELHDRGYEIAAHTCTHENLAKRGDRSQAEYEEMVNSQLRDCRAAIEENTGGECVALAYPYGTYTDFVMETTREAGYRLGFTIDRGAADDRSDPYRLPRQMVVRDNSLKTFKRWLDQEPLHLEDVDPPIGQVVTSKDVTITGRVANGIDVSSLQLVEGGTDPSFDTTDETSTFTLETTLREGANNIRLQYPGVSDRETSWVVLCRVQ